MWAYMKKLFDQSFTWIYPQSPQTSYKPLKIYQNSQIPKYLYIFIYIQYFYQMYQIPNNTTQNIYQLAYYKNYPVKHPQPTHHQQPSSSPNKYATTPTSNNYSQNDDVLKSSDFIASFGISSKKNQKEKQKQKSSSYFLKKMGITQQQLNSRKREYQLPYESRGGSLINNMIRSYESSGGKRGGGNREKLYDFLYKLTGIISYHVRSSQRTALKLLIDHQQTHTSRQHTKIDRLASCNIDIQSYIDNEPYPYPYPYPQPIQKQFDLSINSQTKSQQRPNKQQVFKFDHKKQKNYLKKKRNDQYTEYGFDGIVNNRSNRDVSSIGANSIIKSYDSNNKINRYSSNNNYYQQEDDDVNNNINNQPKMKKSKSINNFHNNNNPIKFQNNIKKQEDQKTQRLSQKQQDIKNRQQFKNLQTTIKGKVEKMLEKSCGYNNMTINRIQKLKQKQKQKYQQKYQQKQKQKQKSDSMRKQSSLSKLIRQKSVHLNNRYKYPQWFHTNLIEQPLNVDELQHRQNYSNQIHYINPDTFKDSSPDIYQTLTPGLCQLQSAHNTSLQVQLALRNNMGTNHNSHSHSNLKSISNSLQNDQSRKTTSQQHQSNNLNQIQQQKQQQQQQINNQILLMSNQLQETNIGNINHVIFNRAGDQCEEKVDYRDCNFSRKERNYGGYDGGYDGYQRSTIANINNHYQQRIRPKSLSINPIPSSLEPPHNPTIQSPSTLLQSPNRPISHNHHQQPSTFFQQNPSTSTSNYFTHNNQQPQYPQFSQYSQYSQYSRNNQNNNMNNNKFVRFVHTPESSNILSVKPRVVSSDHYQIQKHPYTHTNARYSNYYNSPETRDKIVWGVNQQYGRIRTQPIQQPSSSIIRPQSQIPYQSSSKLVVSDNNQKYRSAKNPLKTQSDKKLPIYYGVHSPRNINVNVNANVNANANVNTNPKNYNPTSISSNTTANINTIQQQYLYSNANSTYKTNFSESIQKNMKMSVKSPKYVADNQRKPNQRILVFSSSKRAKK